MLLMFSHFFCLLQYLTSKKFAFGLIQDDAQADVILNHHSKFVILCLFCVALLVIRLLCDYKMQYNLKQEPKYNVLYLLSLLRFLNIFIEATQITTLNIQSDRIQNLVFQFENSKLIPFPLKQRTLVASDRTKNTA